MEEQTARPRKPGTLAVRLAVSLLLCALTFGAKQWYPQAAQTLRPWIVGQEDNRVAQAFSALSASMEQGDGIGRAVQAFYAEMTDDGAS